MASREGKDLAELGLAYSRAVQEDLQGLIGASVVLSDPEVSVVDRSRLGGAEPIAHTVCQTQDDSKASLHLIVPLPQAVALASLLVGIEREQIAEKQKAGLDEDLLDAFGEVMKLAAAVLGRTLKERAELPDLEATGTSQVDSPQGDDAWLPKGSYRLLRFRLTLPEEMGEGRFDVAFPEELARPWFGECTAPGGGAAVADTGEPGAEGAQAVEGAADSGEGGSGPVVVIDASDEDRKQAESLEEALGRSVWSLDPLEFGEDAMGEIASAAAIVIAWDLGGRSGIDLLETLQCDERTRQVPVLMSSPEPTRAMVTAALRAGARSFVLKPYAGDEVAHRLESIG